MALMKARQLLAEEEVKRSKESVEESVDLQKLALQRQLTVSLIAMPGIIICIAALADLILPYC